MFAFPRVRGLFLRSEAPGLVFSATYLWGSSAPTAFSACGGAAASHQSLQKSPMTPVCLTFHVNNLMLRVVRILRDRLEDHEKEKNRELDLSALAVYGANLGLGAVLFD